MGTDAHRAAAAERGPVAVGVITVSDTRTPEDDTNGLWLREHAEAAGAVVYRLSRRAGRAGRGPRRRSTSSSRDAQVVVVNGGTGVSRRDTTYDTLAAMLEKTLPGFGELFRMLSWEQVGLGRDAVTRDRRHLSRLGRRLGDRARPRPSRSRGRS